MKNYTLSFRYSDSFDNTAFPKPLEDDVVTFIVPDEVKLNQVVDYVAEIKHLMDALKIDTNYCVVKEGTGNDWFGDNGYDVGTVVSMVKHFKPEWKIDFPVDERLDFDKM